MNLSSFPDFRPVFFDVVVVDADPVALVGVGFAGGGVSVVGGVFDGVGSVGEGGSEGGSEGSVEGEHVGIFLS